MAKGNNNMTGKRSSSHCAKPYDANNSFVKKVATKVTDFIPQRSWINKWFNISQDNGDVLNDSENPDEMDLEDDAQIPPASKRPRICMDVTHPPGTFFIQPRIKQQLIKQSSSKEQYNIDSETLQPEDSLESTSAGPSGLGSLASSAPATQTNIRNITPRAELNSLVSAPSNGTVNGTDDNSESSESTSGCSSLIPQTNRQEAPSSVAYISTYDERKRFLDDKMNFTNHLQSPRSLFLDNSSTRDSLSSRRPSFNASIMTNTLDRGSPLSSPFYSGNTTFGGANAAGLYKRNRSLFNNSNEYQLKTPERRTNVQVKPSNTTAIDSSGMSQTAKKILEALEHFSSPISDAKRIPVRGINNSPGLSMSKKRTREEADTPSSRVGLRHLTRELTVPTVLDILKLRRRQKLQDTTMAARKIVSARNGPPPPTQEYQLRSESDECSKYQGKVRGKSKTNLDEEETVETVNLPSIPLPISSLPNFNFTLPHNPSATEKTVAQVSSTFTFATPIKMSYTSTSLEPVNNFTFSSPINVDNKHNLGETTIANSATTAMPNFIWSGSSTAPRLKEKAKDSSGSPTIAIAGELKSGSVMDILGSKSCSKSSLNMQGQASPAKSTEASGSLMGSNKGTSNDWECTECLIRNSQTETQCTACKASRFKTKFNQTTSEPLSTSSSTAEVKPVVSDCFGSQFKLSNSQWECTSCCVRNKLTDLKCVSCSTPKAGTAEPTTSTTSATVKTSGLDLLSKFKTAEGSWECPGCMLRNTATVITCPCCNASKPTALKTSPKQNKDATSTSPLDSQDTTVTVTSPSSALTSTSWDKTEKKSNKDFWECPSCMVRNAESATSCPCCTTPKPGSSAEQDKKPQVPPSHGFGSKFKKPEGSWSCDSCMLQNDAKNSECVACSSVKPGCKKAESKDTISTTPKFSFGIPSSTGGFSFGVKSTETESKTTTAPVSGGFKFGDVQTNSSASEFTFGIPKDAGKPVPQTPGTSTVSANSSTNNSNIGSAFQPNEDSEQSNMNKSSTEGNKTAPSLFTFGARKSKESVEESKPFPTASFSFSAPKQDNNRPETKSKPSTSLFGGSSAAFAANVSAASTVTNTVAPVTVTNTTITLPTPSAQVKAPETKSAPVFSFGAASGTPPANNNTTLGNIEVRGLPASTQPSFSFSDTKTIPATTVVPTFGQIITTTTTSTLSSTFTFANKPVDAASPPVAKKPAVLPSASSNTPLFPTVPSTTPLFGNNDAKTTAVYRTAENSGPTFNPPTTNPPAFGLSENKPPPPTFSEAVSKSSIFGAESKMPVFGSTDKTAAPPAFNAPTRPAPASQEATPPAFGQPAATTSLFGTAPVFGNNPPPAFGTNTTPNIFSTTKANETTTPNTSLFTFSSPSTQPIQQPAAGAFNFASSTLPGAAASKQLFTFGSNTPAAPQSNNLFSSGTFNPPVAPPAAGSTFTFNAPPKPAETPAFGQSAVTAPIFGASPAATQTPAGAPPPFSSTPAASTGFNFGNTAPAPAVGGFNFGGIASAPTPSGGFNFNPPGGGTPVVSFDPNAQPSFNFTAGSVPTAFSGIPQQQQPRRIKKAVRRMR